MNENDSYSFLQNCACLFNDAYIEKQFRHSSVDGATICAVPGDNSFICLAIHPRMQHKYVEIVSETSLKIYSAMPLGIIKFHRDILACVQSTFEDEELYCLGGGYVDFSTDSATVYGESTQFGPGNHRLAQRAFESLLLLKNN